MREAVAQAARLLFLEGMMIASGNDEPDREYGSR